MVYEGEECIEATEETWSFVQATLRDRQQMDQLQQVAKKGVESIIKTMLPCRIKLLFPQFGLLPTLMWPFTILRSQFWRSKKWRGLLNHLPKSVLNVFITSGCMEEPLCSYLFSVFRRRLSVPMYGWKWHWKGLGLGQRRPTWRRTMPAQHWCSGCRGCAEIRAGNEVCKSCFSSQGRRVDDEGGSWGKKVLLEKTWYGNILHHLTCHVWCFAIHL